MLPAPSTSRACGVQRMRGQAGRQAGQGCHGCTAAKLWRSKWGSLSWLTDLCR
jgi:Ni,Fe-hydrogenase I small subunit